VAEVALVYWSIYLRASDESVATHKFSALIITLLINLLYS